MLDRADRKRPWSKEDEDSLVTLHAQLGNKWTKISRLLGNRTDNDVKNRYFKIKRKLHAHDDEQILQLKQAYPEPVGTVGETDLEEV
jgi:hypothetical protein